MLLEQAGLTLIPKLDLNFALGGGNFVDGHVGATVEAYRTEWVNRLTRGLPAKLFLTQGDGDSMIPTILDGDDVIVNKAENRITRQDQIWAVGYGDFVAIKRVRGLPDGTFLLMSDNPIVPPIETTAEELRVIGRVIWVGRRM
jgi:phage repressor protein C with HTH and peptisase S24 domain